MKTALWVAAFTIIAVVEVVAAEGLNTGQRWKDLPESERVEVMREWEREREAAEERFEALLMGEETGANGSAVLDVAAGLARLAIADGDYEALPRRLDRPLEPEGLAAVRMVVDSAPALRLVATLRDDRDLEYAYRPLQWPADAQRSAEIMLVVRLLPALAAVQADEGDFVQAYDTLTLLVPIADWLIKERPAIFNGLLASAALRESVRHIEELARRTPPDPQEVGSLKAALVRGRTALDLASVLEGEGAYAQWSATADFYTWREFADYDDDGPYWQILQEAADMAPWQRDTSDWLERISRTGRGIGRLLIPEVRDGIDGFFETHFRIDLALQMLDYYADGVPPQLPIDPFTGDPPRWRETEDGCVVYSIGRNREDDEGVDRGVERVDYDVTWRLPCDLIPAEFGQASNRAAS